MDLATTTSMVNGYPILVIAGDCDAVTARRLRTALRELESAHLGRIIIDLDQATFLDSTALGELVAARRRADAVGSNLPLVCASERISRILRITGMDEVFPLYPSLDAALAGRESDEPVAGVGGAEV